MHKCALEVDQSHCHHSHLPRNDTELIHDYALEREGTCEAGCVFLYPTHLIWCCADCEVREAMCGNMSRMQGILCTVNWGGVTKEWQ